MKVLESADSGSLLAALLSDDSFRPTAPKSLEETGLPASLVEALVCKYLGLVGAMSGRSIADFICLPIGVLEDIYRDLRSRQVLTHIGSAPFNDYVYRLTDVGQERAQMYRDACAYVGPAPAPLTDYVVSVEAQTVRAESPKRERLEQAFDGICVDPAMFDALGPAVNSGAGMFLYGAPGNGKSTLARRMTQCFGQSVWIPRTIIEDGALIKLFDAAFHEPVDEEKANSLFKQTEFDRRWIKIRRPTVVVGGELTLDGLEIRHDPRSNVCEAPIQMKSNCGCLLIDDFGRQRIEPAELLNRWIIPLENKVDYLTLPTGKKFQVPFEQLVMFSTNLEPADLVDEAFLRRIPYKMEIGDPSETEFHELFQLYCRSFGCPYRPEVVNYLIDAHYRDQRPMRRCHPRDLLQQVRNYCVYNDLPMELRPEYLDRVVRSYFTVVK